MSGTFEEKVLHIANEIEDKTSSMKTTDSPKIDSPKIQIDIRKLEKVLGLSNKYRQH